MFKVSVIATCMLITLCVNINGLDEAPKVTVDQGALKGKFWKTRRGREFSAFLSIPYAEPPIGDLRFK
ncbi:hypothetical protein ILUMI_04894, partial [Ignelater luminosus]